MYILSVKTFSSEPGQQGRVDVDDFFFEGMNDVPWHQPQKPCKNHKVNFFVKEDLKNLF